MKIRLPTIEFGERKWTVDASAVCTMQAFLIFFLLFGFVVLGGWWSMQFKIAHSMANAYTQANHRARVLEKELVKYQQAVRWYQGITDTEKAENAD